METKTRTIRDIAWEIKREWKNPYFGAVPYLNAMLSLNTIDDHYGWDSAESIIIYFLGNATTWRGEIAQRIKKELKDITKMQKGGVR